MADEDTEQSYSQLHRGCSQSMLASLFALDRREVSAKLAGNVQPTARSPHGVDLYSLREAARYLCDPVVNVEEYIKKLKPADLPVGIQKAYWEAQNAKLKWEEDAKQLWRTEKVYKVFVDVFRAFQGQARAMEDLVEAKTGLTETQRRVIRELADGMLLQVRQALVDDFDLHDSGSEYHDANR